MNNQNFKVLSSDEVREYRFWARQNYKPYEKISDLWHPIIKAECNLINEIETQLNNDEIFGEKQNAN